ncbi:unnamed protein product [Acanthosepion pharaonis]|uniref:Peptidase A2 domain-containing protein n=1 Tax=Acanthosepion pharaonis TaxID=158019 RepID=A0A812C856_ACAPH|nr:unnamed protein product [Sepia pharaonis]
MSFDHHSSRLNTAHSLHLSALLQLPAPPAPFQRSCSSQFLLHSQRSCSFHLTTFIQCPSTSSAVIVRTPFKRPLSAYHPPFANKDTISIVHNGPSVFLVRSIGTPLGLLQQLILHVSLGDRTPSPAPPPDEEPPPGNNTMAEPILRGLWMDPWPGTQPTKCTPQAHQKVHQIESQRNYTTPRRGDDPATRKLRDLKLPCRRQRNPAPRTRNRSRAAAQVQDRETVRNKAQETNRPTGSDDDPWSLLAHSRLFYVWDRNNGLKFLVDTGAAISVIPPTQQRSALKPTHSNFERQTAPPQKTHGNKELTLNINLRRDFKWTFTVATSGYCPCSVPTSLAHYNLAVHMKTRTCPTNDNHQDHHRIPSRASLNWISVATQHDPHYAEILHRYKHPRNPSNQLMQATIRHNII